MSLWGVKHLGTREGGSWIWQCQNIPIIRFAGQTCSATYITRKHDIFVVIFHSECSTKPPSESSTRGTYSNKTQPNESSRSFEDYVSSFKDVWYITCPDSCGKFSTIEGLNFTNITKKQQMEKCWAPFDPMFCSQCWWCIPNRTAFRLRFFPFF